MRERESERHDRELGEVDGSEQGWRVGGRKEREVVVEAVRVQYSTRSTSTENGLGRVRQCGQVATSV